MEPDSRRISQVQIHKPDRSAAGQQISSKPFEAASAAAVKETHAATTTLMSQNKSHVWDCGSSLYDSFELNSFNLHLHCAITPSSGTRPLLPPQPLPATNHRPLPKKIGRVSKSFQKILRSVFSSSKTVNNNSSTPFPKPKDSFYVFDGSKSMRVLTTIPELDERPKFPQDATPPVRRVASERFTASVGVSCARR